jgi:translation initiation factor 4G
VIDLRRNKWIPRRQDSNPKTIDQIQKEAENEHLNLPETRDATRSRNCLF